MQRMKTDTRLRHGGLAGICRAFYDADNLTHNDLAAFTRRRIITFAPFGINDVRALLVECDDRLVVCFRGTMFGNRRSALRNLSFDMRAEYTYSVHNGFADGLNDVFERLVDALDEANDELPRDVTVIGHSQGGALAEMFAVRILAQNLQESPRNIGIRPDQLVTFAAPRAGNSEFAGHVGILQFSGAEVVRYTNTNDIVPRLPPYTKGFRHGVDETYLTRDARALRSPWALNRWWDGLLDRFATSTVWDTFYGHSIAEYERKLNLVEAQR